MRKILAVGSAVTVAVAGLWAPTTALAGSDLTYVEDGHYFSKKWRVNMFDGRNLDYSIRYPSSVAYVLRELKRGKYKRLFKVKKKPTGLVNGHTPLGKYTISRRLPKGKYRVKVTSKLRHKKYLTLAKMRASDRQTWPRFNCKRSTGNGTRVTCKRAGVTYVKELEPVDHRWRDGEKYIKNTWVPYFEGINDETPFTRVSPYKQRVVQKGTFKINRVKNNADWATLREWNALRLGMTPRQVKRILGDGPERTWPNPEYFIWDHPGSGYVSRHATIQYRNGRAAYIEHHSIRR